jgi:hypothetical protein
MRVLVEEGTPRRAPDRSRSLTRALAHDPERMTRARCVAGDSGTADER